MYKNVLLFSSATSAVPFVVWCFRWKRSVHCIEVGVYAAFILLMEAGMAMGFMAGTNNLHVAYMNLFFDCVLLLAIYRKALSHHLSLTIYLACVLINTSVLLIDVFLISKGTNFCAVATTFESFLFILVAAFALTVLSAEPGNTTIANIPIFWISVGTLIYSVGNIFVFGASLVMQHSEPETLRWLWIVVHPVSSVIFNLCLSRAILCLPPPTSRLSPQ